ELNSWWNSAYRKIFKYNKWESVISLISMLGRLDLIHIINLRSMSFIKKMLFNPYIQPNLMNYFWYVYYASNECFSTFKKFNCDFNWSASKIKFSIYNDY